MSDSNWRRAYTTGLIVVGIGAAIFAYWLWSSTEAQHFEIEQRAAEGAEAYEDPRNIAVEGECLALPEASRTDCITEEREAAYQGQRNEADLGAQRVMAAWTRAIGIATIVGMAFGIFGLGLIFVTFRETRRAADAGFEANKIARESSERQLRAYVGIETGGLEGGDQWPTARIYLKNFGQTPAYNFRSGITAVARPPGHRLGLEGPANPDAAPIDLMPQQGYMLVAEELTDSPARFDPSLTLYVLIGFEFDDAFGEHHVRTIAMSRSGTEELRPYPCESPTNDDSRLREDG